MRCEPDVYNHERVCGNCKLGHRRRGLTHIPSQSKGMISETACVAVQAQMVTSYSAERGLFKSRLPWIVYVNGRRVFAGNRPARFGTEGAAMKAGLRVLNEESPEDR